MSPDPFSFEVLTSWANLTYYYSNTFKLKLFICKNISVLPTAFLQKPSMVCLAYCRQNWQNSNLFIIFFKSNSTIIWTSECPSSWRTTISSLPSYVWWPASISTDTLFSCRGTTSITWVPLSSFSVISSCISKIFLVVWHFYLR